MTSCFTTSAGNRKPIPEEKVRELIDLAMSPPPEHASHWTLRVLAKKKLEMKRNDTTCLTVALDIATGKVTDQKVERHRSQEFLVFPCRPGLEPGIPVHVILDNASSTGSAVIELDGFSASKVGVSFTRIRGSGVVLKDMTWKDVAVIDGAFISDKRSLEGRFYGDRHQEAGGVFERQSIIGAFGVSRD